MNQHFRDGAANAADARPPGGDDYLDSLRDGREIWIYGKRVEDVTVHPAFRNAARSIARLYDALHDPATHAVLTTPTDTGNGGYTHAFFRAARSRQDLIASREAILCWQHMVYGWMGRTPDYKAAFTGAFGANPDHFAPFQATAERLYRETQEKVLFINHAFVNPPIDRDRPPDEVEDICVHAVKETDGGLVVRGAKVVATGSALTHMSLCAHYRGKVNKREFALGFFAPMNTSGVKLICRHSYEYAAAATGSPFDNPLSARFDENDAILVFDDAFVPWENVLFYGDTERANGQIDGSRAMGRVCLQSFTRLTVKLEFIIGLALKAARLAGVGEARTIRVLIGELVMWRNTIWALTRAMIDNPDTLPNGFVVPSETCAMTLRALGPTVYARMKDIVQKVCGSGLIYLNSSAADFANDELRPYLETYLRGSGGADAVERSKTMKLFWDAVGSEFGSRHELYERNYLGGHEDVLMGPLFDAMRTGQAKDYAKLVECCMDDYDLNGWKLPGYFNGGDVNTIG